MTARLTFSQSISTKIAFKMPMLTYQQVRSESAVDEAEQRTTSPENKRLMTDRGEHDLSATESTKRRKLTEKDTIDGHYSTSLDKKKVDPTELASAFALASLASLSPGGASTPPRESREVVVERKDKDSKNDDEVRKAASFESETRSPKASEHPVSPDPRSLRDQDAAVSPGSRRVSFAPNTKESDVNAPSTPVSSNKEGAKSLAMPQQSPRAGNNMMVSPRPHRMYGGRGLPPFVRTPPPAFQMHGTPPPPHAAYHHPAAQRVLPRGISFRHGPPPHMMHRPIPPQFGYGMGPRFQQPGMPPHQLMQPPLVHRTNSSGAAMGPPEPPKATTSANTNQWICDFCNVASFSTYEEACAHEEICKRAGPSAAALMSMSRSFSMASTDEESAAGSVVPTSPNMMMLGGAPPSPHHPQFHHGFTGPIMAARRHPASMALKMGHQQYRMMEGTPNGTADRAKTKGKSREEQQPLTEEERRRKELHLHSLGGHIVYPNDLEMIPPYVHFLMRQVEPCLFTEADRFVARSKGPVGYPGFQCRHCHGHAGLGKYFPVSSKSLSTNSTSQNIHAHMLKCRKCPQAIKDRLVQLKIEKSRAARLEPGWRKVFFDKIWERLHGKPPVDVKQQS